MQYRVVRELGVLVEMSVGSMLGKLWAIGLEFMMKLNEEM